VKSFFSKTNLFGGACVISAVFLEKPTLEFLSLPTDGWHRYPAMIGWLLIFHGIWHLFKHKQKGEP
jgi:hypothetical protein